MKITLDLTPQPCTEKQQAFIDNICMYFGLPEKQMNSEEARAFLNKWTKRFFAEMMERNKFKIMMYSGGYFPLDIINGEDAWR